MNYIGHSGRSTPGACGPCRRARLEFLPTITNPTRKERERHVEALEKTFGVRPYARNVYEASRDTSGKFLRAMDIQKHIFEGRATRRVAVNREVRTWERDAPQGYANGR